MQPSITGKPIRIPLDIGGSDCTGIAKKCYAGLREVLGLPKREVKAYSIIMQTTRVDDDMVEKMGLMLSGVCQHAVGFRPVPKGV